ncbi:unnamed protein product, partial [Coregonus sp. 'balchen']
MEWTCLVKCGEVNYRNVKRNHLSMLAIGLNSPVPAFMRKGRPKLVNIAPLLAPSESEEDEWTPRLERCPPAPRSFRPSTRRPAASQGIPQAATPTVQQPPSGEEAGPSNMRTEPPQPFLEVLTEEVAFLRDGSTADTHSGGQEGLGDKEGQSEVTPSTSGEEAGRSTQGRGADTPAVTQRGAPLLYSKPSTSGAPDRARLTLPSGLEVRTSGIPEAGLGVFNQGNTVPAGAHYGPYEGEITDKDQAMESGYSWVIYKSKHWDDYIDAGKDTHSNWMRYVNCARREEEQNLVAFQYRGEILYRCCKPIAVGEERLVWYGEEYARDLGIVFDYLWDKKSSAKDVNVESFQIFSCSGCPFSFTSQIFLLKHIKRCHHDEYVRLLRSGEIRSENLMSSSSSQHHGTTS